MRVPFARVSMRASIHLHGFVPFPRFPCQRAHALPIQTHFSLSVCLPPAAFLPMRQGHIPEGEVDQYRQQYGIVQQLTYMLETEPHNTPKLLHLMQLLQVYFFHFIVIISLFLCSKRSRSPSLYLSLTFPPPPPSLPYSPPFSPPLPPCHPPSCSHSGIWRSTSKPNNGSAPLSLAPTGPMTAYDHGNATTCD